MGTTCGISWIASSREKKALYDEMTGNVPELNDPAAHNGGRYPHASHMDEERRDSDEPLPNCVEPGIRGRQLVIPIMGWYYYDKAGGPALLAPCALSKYEIPS